MKNELRIKNIGRICFILILALFLSANIVLAATAVKGTIPKVQPLQPAPAGVAPNVSNNIQYQDPSLVPEENQDGSVNLVNNNPVDLSSSTSAPSEKGLKLKTSVTKLIFTGIFLLIFAIAIFFAIKNWDKNEK